MVPDNSKHSATSVRITPSPAVGGGRGSENSGSRETTRVCTKRFRFRERSVRDETRWAGSGVVFLSLGLNDLNRTLLHKPRVRSDSGILFPELVQHFFGYACAGRAIRRLDFRVDFGHLCGIFLPH